MRPPSRDEGFREPTVETSARGQQRMNQQWFKGLTIEFCTDLSRLTRHCRLKAIGADIETLPLHSHLGQSRVAAIATMQPA